MNWQRQNNRNPLNQIDFRLLTYASTLLWVILLFMTISCKRKISVEDNLISDFNNRKEEFDKLVSTLRSNHRLDTLIWNEEFTNGKMKYSAPELYKSLKILGVTEIISYKADGCNRIQQYDLATDWEVKQ